MKKSALEETLLMHINAMKLPIPTREHRFHPPRRWRFDFAWLEQKIAVECEGGTWSGGGHVRGKGYESDCEKYNQAALDGWLLLRFTMKQIKSGMAIDMIEQAIKRRK